MTVRYAALTIVIALTVSACSDEPFTSAVPERVHSDARSAETRPADTGPADAPASTASPPTTAGARSTTTSAEPPVSLPLVDNPTAPALPEGLTVADLPKEPGDRLGLLTEWLEDNYSERSSGHAFAGFDGSYSLRFNIDEADGLYARALCPFYVELAGLYMYDTEHTVAIHGWVRNDSGRYEDAEWATVDC